MDEQQRVSQLLDVWKTTVEVQKHFNELEMTIRRFAISIVGAFAGAAVFVAKEGGQVALFGSLLQGGGIVATAGAVAWCAFWFVDAGWYHRLLKGAVDHGKNVEAALVRLGVEEIALTSEIGKASPLDFGLFTMHSRHKIHLFYTTGLVVMAVFSIALFSGDFAHQAPTPATPNNCEKSSKT